MYLPAVASSDVLALPDKFYSTRQLSALDAHTITCTVPRSCVPIPMGGSDNGLFKIQLPPGINAVQAYTALVRCIETQFRTPTSSSPPPPQIHGQILQSEQTQLTVAARGRVTSNWRYVVGSFAVQILVTTSKVMLPAEENVYSILSWRLSQLYRSDR